LQTQNRLKVRLDVPKTVYGYYFRFGEWSVVDFSWMKDKNHKRFYTEGVYIGWEAMRTLKNGNLEIIRGETLIKLLDSLTLKRNRV
jgi:hypothetical protein